MPCSEKEMKALMSMFVEIMGLQMNTEKLNQCKTSTTTSASKTKAGGSGGKAGSKTNSSNSTSRGKQLFTFPQDLPPPPGGWPEDLLWPNHGNCGTGGGSNENGDYDDEETSSLPDLEDVVKEDNNSGSSTAKQPPSSAAAGKSKKGKNGTTTATTTGAIPSPSCNYPMPVVQPEPVTGTCGIAILEWEALERVAIEDALEQEERARKSAAHNNNNNNGTGGSSNTNNGSSSNNNGGVNVGGSGSNNANANNNNSSGTTSSTASLKTNPKKKKQVEAKKRKALAGWKSRVLAAVQSGQVDRLKPLLDENRNGNLWSGTTTGGGGESLLLQLEGLIVACLPKNRFASNMNPETRGMLTEFLLEQSPRLFTLPTRSNGRSALHSACFYGNLDLTEQIVRANQSTAKSLDDITCLDSGWTLLQYAAVSGSLRAVEYVLQNCCGEAGQTAINTATNDTFTWVVGQHGEGLTVLELIECIFNPDQRNFLETTGMAISEIDKDYLKSGDNAKEYEYRCKMAAIQKRLEQVQTLGAFKPLMEKTVLALEESCLVEARRLVEEAQKEKQQQEPPSSQAIPSEKQELPDDEEKFIEEVAPSAATTTAPSSSTATATTTTTTTTSATNQSSKKGKKNKSKNNNNNKDAVVVEEPTSERPASPEVVVVNDEENNPAEQDPLVSALLAMGFDQEQIIAGIEACGGLHRATADDVVTWIVGQTESATTAAAPPPEPTDTKAPPASGKASKNKKKAAGAAPSSKKEDKRAPLPNSAASTSTPTITNKSDRSPPSSRNSTPTTEAQRQEAAKRAEEERLAAELLAKRKEEQRRRNREWNNKAQVRQRQEAQAKLNQDMKRATAAAAVNKNWPPQQQSNKGAGGKAQQQRKNAQSPKPQPGDVTGVGSSSSATNRSLPENVILLTRDTSSIASSMDNDDATVSTLGSFQTRGATPVMAALGNLNPHPQQQQQLYAQHPYSHPYANNPHQVHPHAQQPPKITQHVVPPGFGQAVQPVAGGDNTFRGYSSSGRALSASSIQPPGIPETQPYVVESNVRSSSMTMSSPTGGPSSAYAASSGSFGAMGSMGDLLAGNQSLGSRLLGGHAMQATNATAASSGISSSSLAGGVPFAGYGTDTAPSVAPPGPSGFGSRVASNDSNMSPVPPSVASSVSGSLAPHHQQQQHLPIGSFGLDTSSSSATQKIHESQHQQQHIDASIIDSISTGNTVLGSSLWGDPTGTAGGSESSTSLLGSLISNNTSRLDAGGVSDIPGSSHPGLFANTNNANQQQGSNDNISEGLWGRGSFHRSASGPGSIW